MPSNVKLGRLPAKRSLKSLALSNYMKASAVPFPVLHAWERPISYGMMANDRVGDCTCAAMAHQVMNWQAVANAGTPVTFTDEQVLAAYSAITGYDGTEATDNGAAELDVLNYWEQTGFAGHKIAGKVTLDLHNVDQIKAAIFIFGGIYIGFDVPAYIMEDTGQSHWRISQSGNTGIVGGHAVCNVGYGRAGTSLVSWGQIYTMTWDFWLQYVEEAYACVSQDWLEQSGISPTGLDLQGLLADLASV